MILNIRSHLPLPSTYPSLTAYPPCILYTVSQDATMVDAPSPPPLLSPNALQNARTKIPRNHRYQTKLARQPLLTQSITTAVSVPNVSISFDMALLVLIGCVWCQVLFATGDVMAQQAIEKVGPSKHNLARTGRMALYGGGNPPPSPFLPLPFPNIPSHSLPKTHQLTPTTPPAVFGPAATTWFAFLARRINFPTRPNLTIAARVLTDQTVFASSNLFCFLSSMAIMEGTDPGEKLRSTYWEALKKNWMVWPAVQAVNFRFVPLEHRVLVVNVVSLGEFGVVLFFSGEVLHEGDGRQSRSRGRGRR